MLQFDFERFLELPVKHMVYVTLLIFYYAHGLLLVF